jgi:hypothetical protein
MKNKKRIENRIQKRSSKMNIQRRLNQKKVVYKERCQKKNRGKLVYQIMITINHFFPQLIDRIREIEDYRDKKTYELTELITAGIAVYLFKQDSRNAMNNKRDEETFKKNYEILFKMRLPHMDTVDDVMRQLDEKELEELKESMIKALLNKRSLHKFRFLRKWFIIAVDGSGVWSFKERHCDNCTHTTSKTGKKTYSHNVLEAKLICANGFALSLATQWIENTDKEYEKQDCETKAFKRLEIKLKLSFPRLSICIVADGLYPNEPFFNICIENDWRFVVNFKEGNLPSVWKKVEQLKPSATENTCHEQIETDSKIITLEYFWINKIDYRGIKLNFLECKETVKNKEKNEEKETYFKYLTDIVINRANVAEVVRTGRLRWKIENEGFNTQKNHGYNLQHKCSRKSWLAAKNWYQCLQMGHMINQLFEKSAEFRKQLTGKRTIKHLWVMIMAFLLEGKVKVGKLLMLTQRRTLILLE